MAELTLICGICRAPVTGDEGCIYVTYPEINAAEDAEREAGAREAAIRAANGGVIRLSDVEPRITVRWRVSHYAHAEDGEPDAYQIGSEQIGTWQELAGWTAHLMEKNWLTVTDWDSLLREVAGEIPARRIRVSGRKAA